jgi:hypothetical protein
VITQVAVVLRVTVQTVKMVVAHTDLLAVRQELAARAAAVPVLNQSEIAEAI